MLKVCGDFPMDETMGDEKKVGVKIDGNLVYLSPGTKYFIHTNSLEENVHFLLAQKLAENGFKPIIITRESENKAKASYPANSDFYFFNMYVKKPNILAPQSLDYLLHMLAETRCQKFFVLIDCLDYLMLYNDRMGVLRFAERLYDVLSPKEAMLIFLIFRPLFEPRELALLERFGEILPLGEG